MPAPLPAQSWLLGRLHGAVDGPLDQGTALGGHVVVFALFSIARHAWVTMRCRMHHVGFGSSYGPLSGSSCWVSR